MAPATPGLAMYQLLYVSSARRKFSAADLQSLLEQCRGYNGAAGITGMMLYEDGNFIQLLEGEKAVIRRLFERIGRDLRHRGVMLLHEEETDARQFESWSMGFRPIEKGEDEDLDAAFALTPDSLERQLPAQLSDRILAFMRNFYRIARRP